MEAKKTATVKAPRRRLTPEDQKRRLDALAKHGSKNSPQPLTAKQIAEKLGITFRHTIEKRIAGAESVGAHKTSMLQDVEHGRSLEIEALVGAVLELGKITSTPAPSIAAVYACVKLLNKVLIREGTDIGIHAAA